MPIRIKIRLPMDGPASHFPSVPVLQGYRSFVRVYRKLPGRSTRWTCPHVPYYCSPSPPATVQVSKRFPHCRRQKKKKETEPRARKQPREARSAAFLNFQRATEFRPRPALSLPRRDPSRRTVLNFASGFILKTDGTYSSMAKNAKRILLKVSNST